MHLAKALGGAKPYLAMILLQVGFAGMYVIAVGSIKKGMNHFVLVVYRNAVAAVVIAPFALWFERERRPKLTFRILVKVMALALFEPVLDQNLYYMGANLTSAGFATALQNLLPAITFVMSILLRIEKVELRSRYSQAKIIGTLVTVAGAVAMILYKGPVVHFFWSKAATTSGHHAAAAAASSSSGNWIKGTILVIVSCTCWSSFFILQSNTLETYPVVLSLTTLVCVFGALESAVVALVFARHGNPWALGFDSRLLSAVYSGVMGSGIAYYLQGIVIKERGPVFVTAFNPLCMIVTALMGSIILSEEITLGRVVGAMITVVGLYAVLWGKSKDYVSPASSSTSDGGAVEMNYNNKENNGSNHGAFVGGLPVTNPSVKSNSGAGRM